MNLVGSVALTRVLDLVNQIPDELLTMDSASYGSFVLAKAQIEDILETWNANRNAGHEPGPALFGINTLAAVLVRDFGLLWAQRKAAWT
ncbi:MAG TPA: hypothetical protein VMP12_02865 [Candidatus Sulfotelmatobacter sp.]|nr:hypothetical protein [Candidatus Sulfotelmatobacter sp.]